jgi:hypothetical protein
MNIQDHKTMLKIIALSALLAAQAAPAGAAGNEGVSGAQFLRIGVDARASALGGAGATTSGAQSMFYNPAGLADIGNAELAFSQVQWVTEVSYSNLAAAKKMWGGALGVSVSYLSVPATDKYDNLGNKLSDSYSASDMAAALGYAGRLGDYASYDDSKATAAALDAGLKYTVTPGRFALGAAVQNLGGKLKYETAGAQLPVNLKAGGELVVPMGDDSGSQKRMSILADVNYLKDAGLYGNLGLDFASDYADGGSFALRGGYRTDIAGGSSGLSLGLGLDMKTYVIDYAYSLMGDIGQAHRLSLTVRFGDGA